MSAGGFILWFVLGFGAEPSASLGETLSDELDSPRTVLTKGLAHLTPVVQSELWHELYRYIDGILARPCSRGHSTKEASRARRNLLLGLGVLFDPGDALLRTPLVGRSFREVVRREEKPDRASLCSRLYIHGRHDTAQHFFLSAALTVVVGPFMAERIGWHKEISDARRFDRPSSSGDGFSFTDMAYNLAGIRYACWLLGWNDERRLLLKPPSLRLFLPDFSRLSLPEKIGWKEFRQRFQGKNEPDYQRLIESIHATLDASLNGDRGKSSSESR